ncbi:MAG: site-specific DNA-methyltransferase [Pirellulales bacterium]|nr:site-specific DNA-methyltransferase [Pirellulales bacterium]
MSASKIDIRCGDCLEGMKKLKPGSIDLAFADPPFNIGFEYDLYEDQLDDDKYLAWSHDWIAQVVRLLKDSGTFWLAIGDEYAAEMKVLMQRELGLTCRSWVIWYYTFGVNCKRKFNRSHAHLLQMVKDPDHFTFNADTIRVPSARQLVYGDRRANPQGRLPDDTWVLRPQDLPEGFRSDGDTWYFARVAGTFKERAGFHGCQMPEQLIGRIVRASSNENDWVLDPFLGSGTTGSVAKKLNRQFIGFELSPEYVQQARRRIESVEIGQPLDGAAEPTRSAPSTAQGRPLDAATPPRRKKAKAQQELTGIEGKPS